MPAGNQIVQCGDCGYFSRMSCYLNPPTVRWDSVNQRWMQKRPSVNPLSDGCGQGQLRPELIADPDPDGAGPAQAALTQKVAMQWASRLRVALGSVPEGENAISIRSVASGLEDYAKETALARKGQQG